MKFYRHFLLRPEFPHPVFIASCPIVSKHTTNISTFPSFSNKFITHEFFKNPLPPGMGPINWQAIEITGLPFFGGKGDKYAAEKILANPSITLPFL
jgi:hypothetical protein